MMPNRNPFTRQSTDGPRAHVMAGTPAHWAKIAFEHVFIESRKRGVLAL